MSETARGLLRRYLSSWWSILFPTIFFCLIVVYLSIMRYNLIQDWMFAPIANVAIAEQGGRWVFEPFPEITSHNTFWVQNAINHFAYDRSATPMFLLIGHYITGLEPLTLNHSPLNILAILFALVFLFNNMKYGECIGKIAFLLCSIIIITSYTLLNLFYSGHDVYGLILGYFVFGLLLGGSQKPHLRSRFLLLSFLFTFMVFKFHHTTAVVLFTFFYISLFYCLSILILSRFFKTGIKLQPRTYFTFTIFCLAILIYDPIFALGVHTGTQSPIHTLLNFATSIWEGTGVFQPYVSGLTLSGKFAAMIPPLLLGLIALPIYLKRVLEVLKNRNFCESEIIIHGIYITGFAIMIMLMAYARPRSSETFYLFIIAVSVLLTDFFFGRELPSQRLKKRKLATFIIIMAIIVITTSVSSLILVNEPINVHRSTPLSQYRTAHWCAHHIDTPYFADRKFVTLIVVENPFTPVRPLYYSYKTIEDARFLYSGINEFAKGFEKHNLKFVVLGKHNMISPDNIDAILLLPNVGALQGIPDYDFASSPSIQVVYTNGQDLILNIRTQVNQT